MLFVETLSRSETFLFNTLPWVFLIVLLSAVFLRLLKRQKQRLAAFATDDRGAAAAMDFVFILPIGIFFISMIIQVLMLAHQSIVIHHAAFKAARSALVVKCSPPSVQRLGLEEIIDNLTCDQSERDVIIRRAALIAALPAASSSNTVRDRVTCNAQNVRDLTQGIVAMSLGYGAPQFLQQALENRVCYVLEPGNLRVTSKWLETGYVTEGLPPVEVTLIYRHPLTAPIGSWLLASKGGRRGDGSRWREGIATVVLR